MNLVFLNYAVDPALLDRFVPLGTELDALDGRIYISLIGFEFNCTRLAGIPIPFHQSFEEVNLRFYVRRGSKRGVVFVRELVPRRAVAVIARNAFGENYMRVPMGHEIRKDPENGSVAAQYSWGSGSSRCAIHIETSRPALSPSDGTLSQFITEHYWGYAVPRRGGSLEYEVQHPRWSVHEAHLAEFSGDPTPFYGAEFARILAHPPSSAYFAEGSHVTVFRGTRIA